MYEKIYYIYKDESRNILKEEQFFYFIIIIYR